MDEAEFQRMVKSLYVRKRRTAAEQLFYMFASMYKRGGWEEDLHRLTQDKNSGVRWSATDAVGTCFSEVSDKDRAWADLHRLTQDEDSYVRGSAAGALGTCFSEVSDEDTAWADLHRLTQDENSSVRESATRALGTCFFAVSDKDRAWADLHRLTQDENSSVRGSATGVLGTCFSAVPDKETAWADLHRLTQDENSFVRVNATYALGTCFSAVSDKDRAWADLHRLTQDENSFVRESATRALGTCFFAVSDKDRAWADLHRLTQDENIVVRVSATRALGTCFFAVSDKDRAWADLHRLTQDEDSYVRGSAAGALGSCFSAVPDKETAWADLHRLTQDEDSGVRRSAAGALGSCFSAVSDKGTAWADLHRLTQDEDSYVRGSAAYALGSCFSAVPDKETAWADLHRLTQDKDSDVRMYAYHSLGSASVYKATETGDEEIFRDELKKAIDYFEQSSSEAKGRYYNPARFCLPFYRSYLAVISEKQEAKAEAAKYLDEAKEATGGSEGREVLLKAVENLANALKEAQKPDFSERREHLRACKQHCDHTAELADSARRKSPMAAAAIERGIPIVEVTIKEIIAEIQEKARDACKQAQGTPAEGITCTVSQKFQKWKIGNQEEMTQKVENIVFYLKSVIPENPQNEPIHEQIDKIKKEFDITKQYDLLCILIKLIPTASIPPKPPSPWEPINAPATIGAFTGFLIAEFGMVFYPTPYTHFISAILAVEVFFIILISQNIKKE